VHGLDQSGRDFRREEVRQIEKRTLPDELLTQAPGVRTGESRFIQAMSLPIISVGL
jgi:hypothetical protein